MSLSSVFTNPAKGYFITGTGTDVGKTLATAALARRLRETGTDCIAVKPLQTGATRVDGRWVLPDCEMYRAAGQAVGEHAAEAEDARDEEFVYAFEPACSPHLAARMAGETISIDRIRRFFKAISSRHECVLVEGVGGVAVPLNDDETVLDLMKSLALPVLLVADNRLGVLNDTLLSLESLRQAGLDVRGVLLTNTTPATEADRFIREDNHRAIEHFGCVSVLAEIAHVARFDPHDANHWGRIDASLRGIEYGRGEAHED